MCSVHLGKGRAAVSPLQPPPELLRVGWSSRASRWTCPGHAQIHGDSKGKPGQLLFLTSPGSLHEWGQRLQLCRERDLLLNTKCLVADLFCQLARRGLFSPPAPAPSTPPHTLFLFPSVAHVALPASRNSCLIYPFGFKRLVPEEPAGKLVVRSQSEFAEQGARLPPLF